MKIGVSSYSFQQLINAGTESQLSIMKKAKDMGFDGIDFIDLDPTEGVSEAQYAEMIREESEKLSLAFLYGDFSLKGREGKAFTRIGGRIIGKNIPLPKLKKI